MTVVAVVDHGAGNLVSIAQGLRRAGAEVVVVDEPNGLDAADAVVLPGVGSTGAAMRRLRSRGLDEALRDWEGPLLGICVGLQLLFDTSEEDDEPCLGMLPGTVRRLRTTPLPHMGWNDVEHSGDPLFADVGHGTPFYFVHSYVPVPDDPSLVVATTAYGDRFASAVRHGDLVGVQFHPERSSDQGLRLLANFVTDVGRRTRAA